MTRWEAWKEKNAWWWNWVSIPFIAVVTIGLILQSFAVFLWHIVLVGWANLAKHSPSDKRWQAQLELNANNIRIMESHSRSIDGLIDCVRILKQRVEELEKKNE